MPYVDGEGVRIHYQIDGEGPPLVLQHGFTSSSDAWRQFGHIPALCRDNR